MIHLTDINDDIARRDTAGIETAFRALVGWPNEEDIGGATRDGLRTAFKAVCEALIGDERIMPAETASLIADVNDELVDGTYSAGADAVLATLSYWNIRFQTARAA